MSRHPSAPGSEGDLPGFGSPLLKWISTKHVGDPLWGSASINAYRDMANAIFGLYSDIPYTKILINALNLTMPPYVVRTKNKKKSAIRYHIVSNPLTYYVALAAKTHFIGCHIIPVGKESTMGNSEILAPLQIFSLITLIPSAQSSLIRLYRTWYSEDLYQCRLPYLSQDDIRQLLKCSRRAFRPKPNITNPRSSVTTRRSGN
jgi:hypothetical protein